MDSTKEIEIRKKLETYYRTGNIIKIEFMHDLVGEIVRVLSMYTIFEFKDVYDILSNVEMQETYNLLDILNQYIE